MTDFSYLNVDNAYKIINQKVTKTPLVTNDYINNLLKAEIYFKLENLQNTGSFKLRGATYKITKLIESVKDSGVVAYSSGNHAQAVAYASMINSISAKIIMPKTAPQIKIENTKKYGAEVILYDTYFQNREEIGNEIQKKDNRALIKPYDDEDIIAGQGTAAIEIVNDLKEQSIEPDLYLCCCGGGGLIAGTSTYLKHIYPNIKSYSVEPDEFDDTKRSLEVGKIIENKKNAKSFCDALLAPKPGNITFQINSNTLEGGLSVSDEEVTKTIILLAEQLKIVVEPGGAVAAAALLNNKIDVKNKKIIVMISGGNIDLSSFNKL
ncbi:threonine/serine dehydratase [Pelagibacteraceae bacterium]|nr:threonine/serine dehydratase [Pelagibacteraceae bacterium]